MTEKDQVFAEAEGGIKMTSNKKFCVDRTVQYLDYGYGHMDVYIC